MNILVMATDKLLNECYSVTGSKMNDQEKKVQFSTEKDPRRNGICHIIKSAQEEEEDMLTFTCHVISAIQETAYGYVIWILSMILSIAALAIGILRFQSCPCERTIPLFLAVGGTILLLKGLIRGLQKCCSRKPVDERQSLYTVNDILTMLMVFWTMTGSVWVFGVFPKVQLESPDAPEYCDYLLYWSAFAMVCICIFVILTWVGFAILLCLFHSYFDDSPPYSSFEPYEVHSQPQVHQTKSSIFILDIGNPL